MGSESIKSGAAFPFKNSIAGVLGPKSRKEAIQTSIQLILTTPKGSVVYNPELGSFVPYLVFDVLDDATINLLLYYVVNDLETQEPRIKVTSVSVMDTQDHKISLWVGYQEQNDLENKQEQAPVDFLRT